MTAAPVSWFEISGPRDANLESFYAGLFGWVPQAIPDAGYATIEAGEGGVAGGIAQADRAAAVFYITVDDPQRYLDQIETAGGTTVVPVTEIPDMVTFAQFADPAGNIVGLVKA